MYLHWSLHSWDFSSSPRQSNATVPPAMAASDRGGSSRCPVLVNVSQSAHPTLWTACPSCIGWSIRSILYSAEPVLEQKMHCWRWANFWFQMFMHLLSFHAFSGDCFHIYKIWQIIAVWRARLMEVHENDSQATVNWTITLKDKKLP